MLTRMLVTGQVCRPGGRILLLENAPSTVGPVGAYQRATGARPPR